MRVKRDYRTVARENYDKFCKQHPEIKISYIKWKEIVYTYNYELRDYILNSGERIKLPWGMGSVAISKKKIKKIKIHEGKEYINLAVNWKRTKEVGKRIYYTNAHTDGYRFKWKWFQQDARFQDSNLWNFKIVRDASRKLKDYLMKPDSPYSQLYKNWTRR